MNRLARLLPVFIVTGVLLLSAVAPVPFNAASATSTPSVWVDVASGTPKNPGHVNDPTLPCVSLALWGSGLSSATGYGYGYGGGPPVTGSYVVLDSKLHVNRSGSWSYGSQGGVQRIATMGTFKDGHWLWALASQDLTLVTAGTFWVTGC